MAAAACRAALWAALLCAVRAMVPREMRALLHPPPWQRAELVTEIEPPVHAVVAAGRRRMHIESLVGEDFCADTPEAFPSVSLCFGSEECDTAIEFLSAAMGSTVAACEMPLTQLADEVTNTPLCPNPLYFSLPVGAHVFEPCPASCMRAGYLVPGCSPPPSPSAPPSGAASPPANPPDPPHAPGSLPWITVSTIAQARRALDGAPAGVSLALYVPPGVSLDLGGAPLIVGPYNLTIASEGNGAKLDAQHLSRVFIVEGGARLHVRSLVLANGLTYYHGGAMRVGRAAVTLSGCTVLNATAFISGGAIQIVLGHLTITDGTSIVNSFAYGFAGAILTSNSHVEILDGSSIKGATATMAGAMLVYHGSLRVTNRSSISSTSARIGGAILGGDTRIEISGRSVIADAHAFVFGGAFYTSDCHISVTGGSSILRAEAASGGAAYVGGFATFSLLDGSTMVSCHADSGGGVYLSGGHFTMRNASSIVSCKASADGGAIVLAGGKAEIYSSTIANCSAQRVGGSIVLQSGEALVTEGSSITASRSLLGGGAVSIAGGRLILTDGSSIVRATSPSDGGAFTISAGDFVMGNGSTIESSSSTYVGGCGLVLGGSVLIANGSSFRSCSALQGGAIVVYGGSVVMRNGSSIKDSTATEFGGALALHSGSFSILDGGSIIGTRALRAGGAVYLLGGALRLQNATISGCTAGVEGSILYSRSNTGTGLFLLTHTELQLGECASVFKIESELLPVFRNLTVTPLAGCNTSLLQELGAFANDVSSVATDCGSTFWSPFDMQLVGVCTPHTSCEARAVAGTPIKDIVCRCMAPNLMNPHIEAGMAVYATDRGCLRPRQMTDVFSEFRDLSVELYKPLKPLAAFNLSLAMQGEESHRPAKWSVSALPDIPLWLSLPHSSGDALGDFVSIEVRMSSAGLLERAVPYASTLVVSVQSPYVDMIQTRTVPVSLSIRAETSFLVWGDFGGEGWCPRNEPEGGMLDIALEVGRLQRVPFTACDQEGLPVGHQLPTTWDPHIPSVHCTFVERGISHHVPIEYTTAGTYRALLTPDAHGDFLLDLKLDGAATPLLGHAVCPANRVDLPDGRCGCPAGHYASHDSSVCELCPNDREGSSSLAGATGPEHCDICRDGFYRSPSSRCISCPVGAFCPYNSTLETIVTTEGYWRLSQRSPVVYKCEGDGLASSCVGGTAGYDSCAEGHAGPLCKLCLNHSQYYQNGLCVECPPSRTALTIIFPILIVVSLALVSGILSLPGTESRSFRSARILARNVHGHQKLIGLMPKCKVFLAFAQIVASLHSTFRISFPSSWFEWTQVLRFFGEIDWMEWLVPSSCIVGNGMWTSLLVRALTPLCAICAIPLLGAASAVLQKYRVAFGGAAEFASAAVQGACNSVPLSLFFTFCLTPAVSASVFQAWNCIGFSNSDNEEVTFLDKDLSIRCDGSPEHSRVIWTAWIFVAIWPIGMVALYAALLFPCRRLLQEDEYEATLLTRCTAFLHRDYKPSYFWWEIPALLYRTILTGWLLLISNPIRIVRLLIALFLSVGYLVAILECQPFRRKSDGVLASWGQVLFICIFGNGILHSEVRVSWPYSQEPTKVMVLQSQVQAYSSISEHPAGSVHMARQFLGLSSLNDIVAIMVICTIAMICLFFGVLFVVSYSQKLQWRLESKWSVCTFNPPRVTTWKRRNHYACFLSHYKMETSSDARYLHDMMRKMLRMPVFIDSVELNDLRRLISEGVLASDVVLVLLSRGVFTRPWCLLEILEATRMGIPVIGVKIARGGFEMDAARHFIANFEMQMMRINPSGLEFLQRRLGADLEELKHAVLQVLDNAEIDSLIFDSSLSDHALVASAQDIVQRLAMKLGFAVQWEKAQTKGRQNALQQFPFAKYIPTGLRRFSKSISHRRTVPIIVSCARDDHHISDARVLCAALSAKLDSECVLGGFPGSVTLIGACELVVAILTRQFLTDPIALSEVYMACRRGIPLVTVNILGAGYDFADAAEVLTDLPQKLSSKGSEVLAQMQSQLPGDVSVDAAGELLYHHLMAIISCPWTPSSSYQLQGLANGIVARMTNYRWLSRSQISVQAPFLRADASTKPTPRTGAASSASDLEGTSTLTVCPRVLSEQSPSLSRSSRPMKTLPPGTKALPGAKALPGLGSQSSLCSQPIAAQSPRTQSTPITPNLLRPPLPGSKFVPGTGSQASLLVPAESSRVQSDGDTEKEIDRNQSDRFYMLV